MTLDLFQFQTGAIKSFLFSLRLFRMVAFQFQTGAIKSGSAAALRRLTMCFNSKLVRLKVPTGLATLSLSPALFQFQTGAIKSPGRRVSAPRHRCFNSKLVRLKDLAQFGLGLTTLQFQFQTGAIKRPSVDNIYIIPHPCGSCQVNSQFFYFSRRVAGDRR